MDYPSPINSTDNLPEIRPRGKRFGKKFFYSIFILGMLLLTFGLSVISSAEEDGWGGSWRRLPLINQMGNFVFEQKNKLAGIKDDRVNVLLLGMGGLNHDGPFLSDTIILASIKPSTGEVALASIPRDLSVPFEDQGWVKINHINSIGEVRKSGSGGELTKATLSKILNIEIPYYARLDFAGFTKLIDEFGGLDINVENTLDDYYYPINGKEDDAVYRERFEHLYIKEGQQHMDGDLALKYVRSRMSAGIEGSDFARSKRQQKVLLAFKNKVWSWETFVNPGKISALLSAYQHHVATNLKTAEIIRLVKLTKNASQDNIILKKLDDGPQGLLKATISDGGAYILIPRQGSFAEIQVMIKNIFNNGQNTETENDQTQNTGADLPAAKIEVQNGTQLPGLGSSTAAYLKKMGYQVIAVNNAVQNDHKETLLYDLRKNKSGKDLDFFKDKFKAKVIVPPPAWLLNATGQKDQMLLDAPPADIAEQIDFLIILGTDAPAL